jgi:hypothetical protein
VDNDEDDNSSSSRCYCNISIIATYIGLAYVSEISEENRTVDVILFECVPIKNGTFVLLTGAEMIDSQMVVKFKFRGGKWSNHKLHP